MTESEAPNYIESVADERVPRTLTSEDAAVFIGAFNRAVRAYATDGLARRTAIQAVGLWHRRQAILV